MDKPLWGLRVQAPLGARVLSFVCCAPNDGFSPQSGLVQRGVLYAAAWGSEPPCGRGNAIPLWWLTPPPCPVGSVSLDSQSPTAPCESSSLATRWEACHWIRGSRGSPMNPVPLPSSTSWGHYKAPLCYALLMKGLLFRALLSHRSAGGRWCRKATKGGKPPEVADYRSAYHAIWH